METPKRELERWVVYKGRRIPIFKKTDNPEFGRMVDSKRKQTTLVKLNKKKEELEHKLYVAKRDSKVDDISNVEKELENIQDNIDNLRLYTGQELRYNMSKPKSNDSKRRSIMGQQRTILEAEGKKGDDLEKALLKFGAKHKRKK